jgi:hypothetical protein
VSPAPFQDFTLGGTLSASSLLSPSWNLSASALLLSDIYQPLPPLITGAPFLLGPMINLTVMAKAFMWSSENSFLLFELE